MQSGFLKIHESLEPLVIPIDSVRPYDQNPKNGDIDAIAESMTINGMYRPIYVQKSTGKILAGNHTYMAAMSLGANVIPAVQLDVDDRTAKRIVLADNRTADLGNYDNSILVELLDQIKAEDSLLGTGYQEYDLEVLRHLSEMPVDNIDDFAQWPTLTFQVPPHVKNAFMQMTAEAGDDRERFELILRLAGWDGTK